MKTLKRAGLGVLALLFLNGAAHAAGFMVIGPPYWWHPHPHPHPHPRPYVPPRPTNLPIRSKSQEVQVAIRGRTASTTVEQVFHNPNARRLEGTFVFPLRTEAAVEGFSLWMNGKEVKGELLDAKKALGIYEDIVRRIKDPGLLEYMGARMFRCRVFPIPANGDCRIKIAYTQPLTADAGLVEYTYPLRMRAPDASAGTRAESAPASMRSAAGAERVTLAIELEDPNEILNVYSPTHAIDVVRKDAKHLRVSLETREAAGERDFQLFYNVSTRKVGLSVIPFRAGGEDGYFMAILTPRDDADADDLPGKDIVFVLDTSGSMAEEGKIEQARAALKFCLASLRERDNFGLVTFATEAAAFAEALQPASKKNVRAAIAHVEKKVKARGGTAIDEALRFALGMNKAEGEGERPFMVVFLTDGEPTIGERDPAAILANVKKTTRANVRLFTFGVGYDVNSALLDRLARENRGHGTYVVPKENLEVKVGAFYAKVSSPVLTDVSIDFEGLDAYDVYPRKVGDIFRDQQVTLIGRYRGKGARAVRLRGKLGKVEKKFVYEAAFPKKALGNDFLPRLWALRKVGYLLEDIRARGESEEVKAEIVRLAKLHGILTPYTSWLVIEDERRRPPVAERPAPAVTALRNREAPPASPAPETRWRSAAGPAPAEPAARTMAEHAEQLAGAGSSGLYFGERGGYARDKARRNEFLPEAKAGKAGRAADAAVFGGGSIPSRSAKELEREEKLEADGTYRLRDKAGRNLVRHVGGRTFYRVDGKWIDAAYEAGGETREVKYLSDEYFKLLAERPELGKFLALGERVIVRSGEAFIEVVE